MRIEKREGMSSREKVPQDQAIASSRRERLLCDQTAHRVTLRQSSLKNQVPDRWMSLFSWTEESFSSVFLFFCNSSDDSGDSSGDSDDFLLHLHQKEFSSGETDSSPHPLKCYH